MELAKRKEDTQNRGKQNENLKWSYSLACFDRRDNNLIFAQEPLLMLCPVASGKHLLKMGRKDLITTKERATPL